MHHTHTIRKLTLVGPALNEKSIFPLRIFLPFPCSLGPRTPPSERILLYAAFSCVRCRARSPPWSQMFAGRTALFQGRSPSPQSPNWLLHLLVALQSSKLPPVSSCGGHGTLTAVRIKVNSTGPHGLPRMRSLVLGLGFPLQCLPWGVRSTAAGSGQLRHLVATERKALRDQCRGCCFSQNRTSDQ